MSEQPYDARWARAPEFAEVAEALGIPTDHILAMLPTDQNQRCHVLYTPELPEHVTHDSDPDVYEASLQRDADGILVVFGEPRLKPGYWAEVRRQVEDTLGDG